MSTPEAWWRGHWRSLFFINLKALPQASQPQKTLSRQHRQGDKGDARLHVFFMLRSYLKAGVKRQLTDIRRQVRQGQLRSETDEKSGSKPKEGKGPSCEGRGGGGSSLLT